MPGLDKALNRQHRSISSLNSHSHNAQLMFSRELLCVRHVRGAKGVSDEQNW